MNETVDRFRERYQRLTGMKKELESARQTAGRLRPQFNKDAALARLDGKPHPKVPQELQDAENTVAELGPVIENAEIQLHQEARGAASRVNIALRRTLDDCWPLVRSRADSLLTQIRPTIAAISQSVGQRQTRDMLEKVVDHPDTMPLEALATNLAQNLRDTGQVYHQDDPVRQLSETFQLGERISALKAALEQPGTTETAKGGK